MTVTSGSPADVASPVEQWGMKHEGLDRLTGTVKESKTQRLLAGGQPNGAPVSNGDGPRQDNWNLDLVGNWTTRTSTEDLTGGGVFTVDGKFDSRNAMTGLMRGMWCRPLRRCRGSLATCG